MIWVSTVEHWNNGTGPLSSTWTCGPQVGSELLRYYDALATVFPSSMDALQSYVNQGRDSRLLSGSSAGHFVTYYTNFHVIVIAPPSVGGTDSS